MGEHSQQNTPNPVGLSSSSADGAARSDEGVREIWGRGHDDIHARAWEGVVGMSGAEDVAGGGTVVCGRLHYVLKR
jgi:hypothetical protein